MKEDIRTFSRSRIAIAFFSLLFSSFFLPAYAATLSLDPAEANVGPGDMFVMTVRIDTDPGECVNAAEVELDYPKDWMKAVAISRGESLLTLWADEPKIDQEQGKVTFSGGIPAGYCGRVQGDPGKTNILAKIAFAIPGNMIGGKTATGPVPMDITFASGTSVLLNDGFGTPAKLTLSSAHYTRMLTASGAKNEWLDIVHSDNTPPDPFSATIEHDPNVYDGKYFVIFSTVDKQSGIDHYEVTEDDPQNLGFVRGKTEHAISVTATSPYLLTDQELKSRIIIRAFDAAGNKQETILPPMHGTAAQFLPKGSIGSGHPMFLWIGSLLGLLLGALAIFLLKRRGLKTGTNAVTENDERIV